MGRRKERRIAANAGRRVKLDLFAEPSGGDLGSSSAQEAVGGGEGDSKTPAELPSSPSSSVHEQQNPLLLLGQYSDEELDEDSSGNHIPGASEDASVRIADEARMAAREETEDVENIALYSTLENVGQLPVDNGSASQDQFQELEKGTIAVVVADDLPKVTEKIEEPTYTTATDEQLGGDAGSGWKMVLHEESNQYYYWNIATGETSWEVPNGLAQETGTAVDKDVGHTEQKRDADMTTYESSIYADVEEDIISSRKFNTDLKDNFQTSESADQGAKTGGSKEGSEGNSNDNEKGTRDASQDHGTSLLGKNSTEDESISDSLELVNHCESLLERLNDLKGFNCYRKGQDLKLKYTLEIETRLADIKALACYGSSLLPFWLHSEYRLKELEAAILDISQHQSSTSPTGFEATSESREGIGDVNKAPLCATYNDGSTNIEQAPLLCSSSMYLVGDVGGKNDINGIEKQTDLTPTPAFHSCEEVDMDVDMDVEDTFTSTKSPNEVAQYNVSTEKPNLQNTLVDQEPAIPPQEFCVSPVEQWIPPPPPDNEPFPPPPPDDEPFPPPPPPDEPPEIAYATSSNMESVQPFTYSEQYHLSYPLSSLEYYGQADIEPPGTTPYTHPEGGQLAVSHLPHYYDAVTNVYPGAPLVINPVDSSAYYGIQEQTMNPVSVISNVAIDSLGAQSQHVVDHVSTAAVGALGYHADAGSSLLPESNLNDIISDHRTVKVPAEVPSSRPFIEAPATSLVTNISSVPSTSDNLTSVSVATATTSKVPSKVPRGKKRAVAVVSTLRSNKKVSSLVDKWKAAKEELHEEEEEPEDAYEILERKRQREIEEWRAHQIASGEAKDNANFQPLGGDWRERVKRKRAKKMKEMKETGQSSSDVKVGNQPPDVIELSKGLPSGWQAYLDDSSKQVYYGNVLTSETSWTRPAD